MSTALRKKLRKARNAWRRGSYEPATRGTLDTVERDGGLGAAVDRTMPCANLETVSHILMKRKKERTLPLLVETKLMK